MSVIELRNVNFSYDKKRSIFKDLNYQFDNGKVYAIVGKSGAGKSTLLSMLSNLMQPTSGSITYENTDLKHINPYEYRSKYVGVIFQSYNLLPNLTAEENVILSMDISNKKISNKVLKAKELLRSVGLEEEQFRRRILKLSGGEQQRVAIARTLAFDPDVILADEPTGNLDGNTQDAIMKIFMDLAKKQNKCVILVTHSPVVAKMADERYELLKK